MSPDEIQKLKYRLKTMDGGPPEAFEALKYMELLEECLDRTQHWLVVREAQHSVLSMIQRSPLDDVNNQFEIARQIGEYGTEEQPGWHRMFQAANERHGSYQTRIKRAESKVKLTMKENHNAATF